MLSFQEIIFILELFFVDIHFHALSGFTGNTHCPWQLYSNTSQSLSLHHLDLEHCVLLFGPHVKYVLLMEVRALRSVAQSHS